ncbi:NAD(P)H-binding protein [Vibrio sp. MarTm2]|uniref:NAD(P)H-binding protein n=1 Tax=Vibrio sp. MarTm2 TaxID=2998831 RepID=UPI0022CD215F|nr:NAD(P)H-binding protein [Vibrio sp. MarTm2]MDA0128044.1 NAD(P)H-binding protein [Vibrio sp. MarTm2]
MKTALILGISGNFGAQMAMALHEENWQIRALVRDKSKAPNWVSSENVWVGDASDEKAVEQAAAGVDLIVYGVNPTYDRWPQDALRLLEPSVRVAEKRSLRLLFPGNVYNFAPSSEPITEDASMSPVTEKGVIRVNMEQRLRLASQQGASITIVRAGDYIGPKTQLGWLDAILKQKQDSATMQFPHDEQHVHFWCYLPDFCANTAKLMLLPQSRFEVWHDEGLTLSQEDWQQAFLANGQLLKTTRFSWWLLKAIGLFKPVIGEVVKMRYLWQQPVILSGKKMRKALGENFQSTPLSEILLTLQTG